MLKLFNLVHCFFPDFEKNANYICFLPTFSNFCQKKNYLFTLFKTLISQKVWLLGKNDRNEVIRIELIEFNQLV